MCRRLNDCSSQDQVLADLAQVLWGLKWLPWAVVPVVEWVPEALLSVLATANQAVATAA